MNDPAWLKAALADIGTREIPGLKHNPAILRWWTLIRAPFTDDETPWCAAFVGGKLEEVGIRSSRSAAARSYLQWGVGLKKPVRGCIVVFSRPGSSWSGHVGFVAGRTRDGDLAVLGGNQSNAVNIKPFGLNRVLGYRWPKGIAVTSELPTLRIAGGRSVNEA